MTLVIDVAFPSADRTAPDGSSDVSIIPFRKKRQGRKNRFFALLKIVCTPGLLGTALLTSLNIDMHRCIIGCDVSAGRRSLVTSH
jgi:hypothetical protein